MAVSPTEIHVEVIPPKSYYLDATCSPLQGCLSVCLSLHTTTQPNATPLTYLKYTAINYKHLTFIKNTRYYALPVLCCDTV
jgi:hypothetical protein